MTRRENVTAGHGQSLSAEVSRLRGSVGLLVAPGGEVGGGVLGVIVGVVVVAHTLIGVAHIHGGLHLIDPLRGYKWSL